MLNSAEVPSQVESWIYVRMRQLLMAEIEQALTLGDGGRVTAPGVSNSL